MSWSSVASRRRRSTVTPPSAKRSGGYESSAGTSPLRSTIIPPTMAASSSAASSSVASRRVSWADAMEQELDIQAKAEMKCTLSLNDKRQMTSNCLVMFNAKGVSGQPSGLMLKEAIDQAFRRYCALNRSVICDVTGTVIMVEGEEKIAVPSRRAIVRRGPMSEVDIVEPIAPLKAKYTFHVREYFTYRGKSVSWFFVWTSHPSLAYLLGGLDENGGNAGPKLTDTLPNGRTMTGVKLGSRILRGDLKTYTDAISPNPSNKIIIKLADGNDGLSPTGQNTFADNMFEELQSFVGSGENIIVDSKRPGSEVFVLFEIVPVNAQMLHDAQLRMAMFVWFNNNYIFNDPERRGDFKIPMYYVRQ